MFSDALDVDRCIELKQAADEAGIGASFGVGTNLTNGALLVRLPRVARLTFSNYRRFPLRRQTRAARGARRRPAAD